jgi:hypothetical protein
MQSSVKVCVALESDLGSEMEPSMHMAASLQERDPPRPWMLQLRQGKELGQKAGFSSLMKSSSKETK